MSSTTTTATAEQQSLLPKSVSSSSSSTTAISDANYGATEAQQSPIQKVEKGLHHKKFREIWVLFLGLASAVFCSALGATIVANLTIEIGSYFHAGALSSWLGTGFLVGMTAMTPLYGRLAQVLGRKGVMLLALALFLTGTVLCAIAPSMSFMIAARVIAGAGSGGLLTVAAIIISDLVSIADRGLYQGGINVLFGAGSASGAVFGGYISDRFGWRAAFWIQVPVILFTIGMVIWKVNVEREEGEDTGGQTAWDKLKAIDWSGSISSFSTFSSLLTSSHYPFKHPLPLSLFILSIVSVPVFIIIEKRANHPILPLSLLTRTQPSIVLLGFVLTTATNFSRLYMQPVYLHVTRGLNGSQTGLLLIPSSVVGAASSLYAGWHMRHYKEYKWFQVVASLIPEMALGATGGGATITTLLTSLIACVEPSELSIAISACYLYRSFGQVLGVAISASIQQSLLLKSLSARFPTDPTLVQKLIQEPSQIIPLLKEADAWQARLGYLDSIRGVFAFVVAGGALLSVLCFFIRGKRL
nr:uncharacterized protein CI109_005727 [Kwoniella shandongensis]KAA5525979.1 hypothetical protein CI109_005727 [Kwoniella shandongensis]